MDVVAGRVPVIGCTSGIVTAKVIDESRAAKEAGCDSVMVRRYAGPVHPSVFHHSDVDPIIPAPG